MGEEKTKQIVSRLVKNDTEMLTACFDEYFFVIPEGLIKPYPVNAKVYNMGDRVPVKGKTYQFPVDFNIIDLHFKKVAVIRNSILFDLVSEEDYLYDGYPAVNMMGFGIRLDSKEDFDEFKADFKSFCISEREKLADFANRWFDIIRYRKIGYL